MPFYMDKDIDIGDIFRAPISQRNNTPGRSMPIRELKLKHASVKIHEIVLCIGMHRGGFWVTAAHGGLQRASHTHLQNVNDISSVSAVLRIKQRRTSLRIGARPTLTFTRINGTMALTALHYPSITNIPLKRGPKCSLSSNFTINSIKIADSSSLCFLEGHF